MKKLYLILAIALVCNSQIKAWWDPGHLVTAMIAYKFMDDDVKEKMENYVELIRRDYAHINHFVTLAVWPDDIKGEGVHSYDQMHYTNIPYNPQNIAIQPPPEVNVLWAIDNAKSTLASTTSRDIEKARQLAFLVHFTGDIHQPLHSTTMYTNEQPGGNAGGNLFFLQGEWSNLHKLWDDGCGYLSSYNNINPYGAPKEALTDEELQRLEELADELIRRYPIADFENINSLDMDFWALESHKLAVEYGYHGVVSVDERGRKTYIKPNTIPSEYYIMQGQEVVRQRLVIGGYRLAKVLNQLFGE